ncbi:hypothetical protein DFR70_104567 [Nocardia tenerifensis]|uniref:Uncharacterized protein n=2 Tax=Nocardia tenerifensis TaxID=228006 RepID=A0A318KG08_9NOCA|nr:hypothetical protein [Nocardia tenerifensis]PXX65503.1 hypothetical protein DFR70_104567 [Nocardia tenerifensis]
MKSLRWIAVGVAALAVAYYLFHGLTYVGADEFEPAGMGWLGWQMVLPIIALTLVPMVFAFTGEGILAAFTGRNSAAFRDGLVGLGTIRSFAQTGLTVNDQPQVRIEFSVEGVDGKTFASTAKMIVPLTELALLQPGVVLPVRYLPDRTDRVEVDLSGDASMAQRAMNESMIRKGITTRHKLDIAERGIATQAVVQSLSVPGEIRDGHSKIELGLAVTRPDGSTFTTRVEKFLAPSCVGQVQVGRILRVHYLPENEHEVVIALAVNA